MTNKNLLLLLLVFGKREKKENSLSLSREKLLPRYLGINYVVIIIVIIITLPPRNTDDARRRRKRREKGYESRR